MSYEPQVCVEHGANIKATTNYGRTALMAATETTQTHVVEYLHSLQASPKKRKANDNAGASSKRVKTESKRV